MLVDVDPRAHDGGFPDHHAGAVVDEEAFADRRAGVDVDAGARIGELGDQPRDDRRAEIMQSCGSLIVDPISWYVVAKDEDRGRSSLAYMFRVSFCMRRYVGLI